MIENIQSNGQTEILAVCPGCGSVDIGIFAPPTEYKIFLTDADEMPVTTGVSGCGQCGLTFLNPRMGQQALFSYYSKQSRIPRDSIDVDSPFAVLMEMQIDFISKFKPLDEIRAVLEIGCAEAFFLQSIKARTDKEVRLYGVELSEKYIQQALKLLPEVTLYEKPLEEVDFGEIKFDLIVLRHVFEHLSNPADALEKIRSILSPNGILYIEVPDSQNADPSVSRFYHHEHLLYFTVPVLDSYLKTSGFKPLAGERFTENPVGSGFSYPVIRSVSTAGSRVVFEAVPGYAREVYLKNQERNSEYIAYLLAPVRKRLLELSKEGKRLSLFGAGPHTMDLLELLEGIQWNKIFDNNPDKQGKFMRGIPIVKPDDNSLKSVDCVLISSGEFEREMIAQVNSLVGREVEVIPLYGSNVTR